MIDEQVIDKPETKAEREERIWNETPDDVKRTILSNNNKIVLFKDRVQIMKYMSIEQRGLLITMVLADRFGEEIPPTTDSLVLAGFDQVMSGMLHTDKSYLSTTIRNRANGNKPKKPKTTEDKPLEATESHLKPLASYTDRTQIQDTDTERKGKDRTGEGRIIEESEEEEGNEDIPNYYGFLEYCVNVGMPEHMVMSFWEHCKRKGWQLNWKAEIAKFYRNNK